MTADALPAYRGLAALYGDLHNHCGISYGHGTIEEAFANARERLDFCSVTGHAFWPDMPAPNPETRHIIDFHEVGFARLKRQWPHVIDVTAANNADGTFAAFLGFEMHSMADGDHTVLYRDGEGEILHADSHAELMAKIRELRGRGAAVLAFPHHIGYLRGRRGLNWDTFDAECCPVVEIISMHGCSEACDSARPFLHTMGPADSGSTMRAGLAAGHVFGVIGSTDHHSAHPASYGHGMTGLWAGARTREAVWDALLARRTYALTGDRIELQFTLNGEPMGSQLPACGDRLLEIHIRGGAAIDCVDVIRNGRLLHRFSECDVPQAPPGDTIRTKLLLEVGWGPRDKQAEWDVTFGISDGRILAVEPRFRGAIVVAPSDRDDTAPAVNYNSHWEPAGDRAVHFRTVTTGNPNNWTPATQGMCLTVEMPAGAAVRAELNDVKAEAPLTRLLAGAKVGFLRGINSQAWRLARAPLPWEFQWALQHTDAGAGAGGDTYYIRVRQTNDQWAWSSPIFVG